MASSAMLSLDPYDVIDEMHKEAYVAANLTATTIHEGSRSPRLSSEDLQRLVASVARGFRSATAAGAATALPSLNTLKNEELRDGMLVRFRGMVQDMFEMEFYLADFRIKARSSSSTSTTGSASSTGRACGLFRDVLSEMDPCEDAVRDRQSLYCVPVPGESFWVKDCDARNDEPDSMQTDAATSTTAGQSLKRPSDDATNGCVDEDENDDNSSPKKPKMGVGHQDGRSQPRSSSLPAKEFLLNFPLASEKGRAIIAKIYDSSSDLKVCDVCEFVGILSLDKPAPPSDATPMDSDALMDLSEMECDNLLQNPPSSLVPRLHVLYADKIRVNNPLLPPEIRRHSGNDVDDNQNGSTDAAAKELKASLTNELAELKDVKTELTALLKTVLMDDELAAEYLLCHLVSSIHSRRDLRPIGKMTLNLSNCPSGFPLGKRLSQVLEWLCTSVDRLPMSLPVLNGPPFVPTKNYELNRLISSRLQLSRGTRVVLDETMLSPGQLNEKGVKNLAILGTLIQWQKLDYDFQWSTQEFPTDLRLVVVSEGKSLLPSDFQIHLNAAQLDQDRYDARLDQAIGSLSPATWSRFRRFLSLVEICPYEVDDSVQKTIEEDFVAARAESERNLSVEDFERLLVLARYSTLLESPSNGGLISIDVWRRCQQMEEGRKNRIPPARGGGGNGDCARVGVEQ